MYTHLRMIKKGRFEQVKGIYYLLYLAKGRYTFHHADGTVFSITVTGTPAENAEALQSQYYDILKAMNNMKLWDRIERIEYRRKTT